MMNTAPRTNADAERVSDIVAELRADAPELVRHAAYQRRVHGTCPPGDNIFEDAAAHSIAAADIIEAQSKALAEAREVLRPAGNIAFNMKQTAIYTSDRDNYRRISEAIDVAIRTLTPTPENPNG